MVSRMSRANPSSSNPHIRQSTKSPEDIAPVDWQATVARIEARADTIAEDRLYESETATGRNRSIWAIQSQGPDIDRAL